MKYLNLVLILFLFASCQAQDKKLLIQQEPVDDLSGMEVYPKMIIEENGETKWKKRFEYLDDIEISKITYLSDGLKVNGFLIKPKKEGTYPCIIYNRGGNRGFGELDLRRVSLMLGPIANKGYIVIASNYRGNGGSEGQEEFGGADVNDVVILPEVLEEVEGADTDKIGMYGWSRGGMMTYLALMKTDRIKAAATGGAPADKTIIHRPSMETNVYAELIPDYWKNKEEELKKRSAIHRIDEFPKDVPILVMHGNADWRVLPEQSLQLAVEFQKNKIPYRLMMFEGGDHGITERRDEVFEEVMEWFDRYLKNEEALPDMEPHGK